MDTTLTQVSSKRLDCREITETDADFISLFLSDSTRTRYLPLERPYTAEEASEWLTDRLQHWKQHRFGICILRLHNSRETIGYCGLEHVKGSSYVDLRYGLIQQVWGKRYGFEAASMMVGFGFEHLGLKTIYGAAVPENLGSIQIFKKIGMSPDINFDCYGDVVDPYSITKSHYMENQYNCIGVDANCSL